LRNWQEDMELCEKATRGPWEIKETQEGIECPLCGGEGEVDAVDVDGDGWGVIMQSCGIGEMIENNARFTITAREALPYWLNAYRELEAEAAAMRNRLQKAEAVIEAAKDTCEELWGHGLIAIEALQKALDDLEGGGA